MTRWYCSCSRQIILLPQRINPIRTDRQASVILLSPRTRKRANLHPTVDAADRPFSGGVDRLKEGGQTDEKGIKITDLQGASKAPRRYPTARYYFYGRLSLATDSLIPATAHYQPTHRPSCSSSPSPQATFPDAPHPFMKCSSSLISPPPQVILQFKARMYRYLRYRDQTTQDGPSARSVPRPETSQDEESSQLRRRRRITGLLSCLGVLAPLCATTPA
ncbi:hypothetical protein P170DRAFT_26187 [Aspergillus steynii IBT 23096]|uniref:Uncharacterized protein n=1 Tax=Aspergillus steynii IBT 23096 TaxID=1392250 RepID=A0A2I2GPP9_9EURO|nr:uncharacterized protein P170DRAFT_26187 [Aspergillus steynii IBT 23096]PLB54848.1 hypothetical protein P170DRAFT_26187 [Aspergillus steynii IBT 23096]